MGISEQDIDTAYQKWILPYHKNPINWGKPEKVKITIEAFNPLCGDKFQLYLTENNSWYFDGIGCALSRAAISIMLKYHNDASDNFPHLCENFILAIESQDANRLSQPELKVFVEIIKADGRADCITLGWKAISLYLKQSNQ